VWGLDLVGPLQKAPGGFTHLLVAIDKFSKWIEVRPLNSIRSEQAVAFFTNTAPASAGRPKAQRQVLTPVLATKTRMGPSQNTSTALAAYDML
jgi:hypothetical protein